MLSTLELSNLVSTSRSPGRSRWVSVIAVSRNVFLYPNFQFDWETWREDDFNFARKNTRASGTVGFERDYQHVLSESCSSI